MVVSSKGDFIEGGQEHSPLPEGLCSLAEYLVPVEPNVAEEASVLGQFTKRPSLAAADKRRRQNPQSSAEN
jgi:hypothetical protein